METAVCSVRLSSQPIFLQDEKRAGAVAGGGWRGDEGGVRAGQSAGAQAQPGRMRGRPPRGQQALVAN